ncbi:hypothetical protein [Lacibacter sp. H407]|uniref:hypothetical protein n=1 Tax=Lacibacter sp. H407 TaxID=3133423 RepID=UPI0030C0D47E
MERSDLKRVVFYSKIDMSAGYNLKNAERLLNELDGSTVIDINDLLEIYHIRLYFDNELYLNDWDNQTKEGYKAQVEIVYKQTQTLFRSFSDESLLEVVGNVDYNYRESFWRLFSLFQVFKNVKGETVSLILEGDTHHIFDILTNQPLVKYYDKEIRAFLLEYGDSAELLLANFEEEKRHKELNYHFPKSLTIADKERIIESYIEQNEPNLNYIRLIEHSKDSEYIKLSTKVRLKAKKKAEQLNNRIFETGYAWQEKVSVSFNEDQTEPATLRNHDHTLEASYSVAFLDSKTTSSSLFLLFKTLFTYTDIHGLITLVNKDSEMDVMEKITMQSKNEYNTGIIFRRKEGLSQLQLVAFEHYLKQKGKTIETLIESYIKQVINDFFGMEHVLFKFPSENTTYLERIRIVAPEMESLLKQFQTFSDDGEIDFDLIELNSKPLAFSEIKSLLAVKYGYIKNDKAKGLKFQFFSDQSPLFYVEPFRDKHDNLFNLLSEEDVTLDHFKNYQIDSIKELMKDNFLIVDGKGYVKINEPILLSVIGDIHRNTVVSYWHYSPDERKVLNRMAADGFIRFEDTLFTKGELNYFNYYLNKKEYTNGLDIRNKYLHGTNKSDEKMHEYEYRILLKLIVLVLLKITDDLMLAKRVTNEYFQEE